MRKRRVNWLFVLLSIPAFVFGGIGVLVPLAQAGRVDWGVSTAVSERYDDNIFLTERDEEDDWITAVTPMLTLDYQSTDTQLNFMYLPSFDFYLDNPDENDVRHNGNANLVSNLTPRLTLLITDILSFEEGSDVGTDDRFEDRRTRSRSVASDRQSNDFNTTLIYQLFQKTSVRGSAGWRFDHYDESEEADSDEYYALLGADHQVARHDTLFCNYRYRIIDYDGGQPEGQSNDTDIHSFDIGDTHEFSRSLVLSVSGGISYIDEDTEDSEEEWNAHVSLAKDFHAGNVVASYDRGVSPGRGGTSETTVSDTFNLSASKDFSKRLNGSFSAFHVREKSTQGNLTDREDTGVRSSASYEFTRRLSGTLAATFIRQDSRNRNEGDTDNYLVNCYLDYQVTGNWSLFSSYRYYQQNALDPIEEDIENNVVEVGIRVAWF